MIKEIKFPDSSQNLIRSYNDVYKQNHVTYSLVKEESNWVDQYNKIKDQSWPDCSTFKDFYLLPDWMQEECINIHKFSPDIWKDAITEYANNEYNHVQTEFRYEEDDPFVKCLKLDPDIIRDQNVIDFACNRGKWSFYAVENNCQSVLGTDVRPENIEVANSLKLLVKEKDKINFIEADIHDYENNKRLCQDKDVVFLSGIMYHVHDHYPILESTCLPNVKQVVIQSLINKQSDPVIMWKTEMALTNDLAGWKDGEGDVLVGIPNVAYFDLAMKKLGYTRTYIEDWTKFEFSERAITAPEGQYGTIVVYKRV